jgi:DNA invertase Pin-like site-specific DNA recombinase
MPTPNPTQGATSQLVAVAQYVRASTDRQCYSTQGQSEANTRYAAQNGMHIVSTYEDEGRSGLSLKGRPGLMRLLEDIQRGGVAFSVVLVFDVSRWGRFQDVDESAFYEYLCRRAGIRVVYCAETFGDVEGPMGTLFKALKRAMAGEFSRELSKKVFAGQCRLVERGYRQGGVPGYALRRMLIGENGESKGLLAAGERKSLQGDRVVLVPGPPDEVALVQRIYARYIDAEISERGIVQELNAEGLLTERGKPWCRASVRQVLTNPKYCGINLYNRASFKLRATRMRNPEDLWVRKSEAYAPVVSLERYQAAQAIRAAYTARMHTSADEMVAGLRRLLKRYGQLTADLIDRGEAGFRLRAVMSRFGSLKKAYEAVGFEMPADTSHLDHMRRNNLETHALLTELVERIRAQGVGVRRFGASPQIELSTGLVVRLVITRPGTERGEREAWRRKCSRAPPDLFVVYRMAHGSGELVQRFMFPREHMPGRPKELEGPGAQVFRVDDEAELVRLVTAAQQTEVA